VRLSGRLPRCECDASNVRICRIPGDLFRCRLPRHGPPRVIFRIDLYEIKARLRRAGRSAGGAARRPRPASGQHQGSEVDQVTHAQLAIADLGTLTASSARCRSGCRRPQLRSGLPPNARGSEQTPWVHNDTSVPRWSSPARLPRGDSRGCSRCRSQQRRHNSSL
jgi:hypothetical protein